MLESRAVQVTLMGVLIGIGLPLAIASTASDFSVPLLLAGFAYVLQALNFFHGKIATLEDTDYSMLLRAKPRLSLFDYVLNMLVTLSFVVIGVLIDNPLGAILANAVLRAVDAPLVLITMRVSTTPALIRAQRSWLWFDLVSLVAWSGLAIWILALTPDALVVAWIFGVFYAAVAVADIVMDYSYNAKLYFQPPNPWEAFTATWDEIQGEYGDPLRRYVIAPTLVRTLLAFSVETVLDLGSGNGALARSMAVSGFRVTGVDKSSQMVIAAETYGADPAVAYVLGDVRTVPLVGRRYDAVVCAFSHHEIGDLDAVFDAALRTLDSDGVFILIGEDLDLLSEVPTHAYSRRRWLDAHAKSGKRRQLIYWRAPQSEDVLAVTTSTYWSHDHLTTAAARWGFSLSAAPSVLVPEDGLSDLILRRYAARPYIRQWVFTIRSPGEGDGDSG